ncbi:tRNA wybutosine-synthesizing protein 4 [Synchiropus splendidus]|uniref:tRNA wybutosine-synthesizing protein 4 n=1 Tax=Synchiropus splendidus TaxID=270530 RepID=UPI00237D377A|nr:tRNA wybutosine-synthesizing protein 4 [Synchiropus splendidus]
MPTNNRKKQGADTAVQGTNDSSVVSKVSAATQGYFQDLFLQHFVSKVARRAPLINRGYYVRWKAVDHCVKKFLQVTEQCSRRQVLSLGAGFDSLYFRLHAEGELDRVAVFEVDFPDVTRRKAALIQSSDTLRAMLDPQVQFPTGAVCVSSHQYHLLGVDVRDELAAQEVLSLAGLDWTVPTVILSEVVLTYMETKWSDSVISWTSKLLPHSLFVMYEQIHPNDPFGQVMQEHFLKLNSKIHALLKYPDTAAQMRRFLDRGWDKSVCLDMNNFYLKLIPEAERCRVEVLEPFDEFEEWHQKCSHYFILTASRGPLAAAALLAHPHASLDFPLSWSSTLLKVRTTPVNVEGLGMTSSVVDRDQVLLVGGCSRVGRGKQTRVLRRGPEGWMCVSVEPSEILGVRLYHTSTPLPGGGALIYGGRLSPLNSVKGDPIRVTVAPKVSSTVSDCGKQNEALELVTEEMACAGAAPAPRWRHSATVVRHRGEHFVFVFGGKNESAPCLADSSFLCLEQKRWTQIPLEGAAPEARHSHSASAYQGGALIFGGLGMCGESLGDLALLRPTERGFCWETLPLNPPPVPRYSHRSHVIGRHLCVVGGVWLHSHQVPGVVLINLETYTSVEFPLDTTSVPRPLMLHSFCSELMDQTELLLIGGGGNCFSFGTHFNPQLLCVDLLPALGP